MIPWGVPCGVMGDPLGDSQGDPWGVPLGVPLGNPLRDPLRGSFGAQYASPIHQSSTPGLPRHDPITHTEPWLHPQRRSSTTSLQNHASQFRNHSHNPDLTGQTRPLSNPRSPSYQAPSTYTHAHIRTTSPLSLAPGPALRPRIHHPTLDRPSGPEPRQRSLTIHYTF